jgi:elongation factor Ts
MEVTAKLVSELRQKTGAGMMDCKQALAAENGNLDKAIEYLRKKGMSSSDKRAARIAA